MAGLLSVADALTMVACSSDYIEGKQTLSQLAERYGVCVKTVWNHLKSMRHVRVISKHKDVVVNMDTTYWGRGLGLMVIKDSFLG